MGLNNRGHVLTIGSEFGGSLELIKLETHEQNHLRIPRGMRKNQLLHVSRSCCSKLKNIATLKFMYCQPFDKNLVSLTQDLRSYSLHLSNEFARIVMPSARLLNHVNKIREKQL